MARRRRGTLRRLRAEDCRVQELVERPAAVKGNEGEGDLGLSRHQLDAPLAEAELPQMEV